MACICDMTMGLVYMCEAGEPELRYEVEVDALGRCSGCWSQKSENMLAAGPKNGSSFGYSCRGHWSDEKCRCICVARAVFVVVVRAVLCNRREAPVSSVSSLRSHWVTELERGVSVTLIDNETLRSLRRIRPDVEMAMTRETDGRLLTTSTRHHLTFSRSSHA